MAAQLGVGFGGYLRFPYPVIQNSSRWLKGKGDWDHGAFTGAGNGGLGAWGVKGAGVILAGVLFFSASKILGSSPLFSPFYPQNNYQPLQVRVFLIFFLGFLYPRGFVFPLKGKISYISIPYKINLYE